MEQTNLIVTADGKSWDEVTRDTSYIGNIVVKANAIENKDWANLWMCTQWRGGLDGKSVENLFNKDFAIAFDRIVCLRAGRYKISVQWGVHGSSEHFTVTKNGVNSHYAYHNTNTDGAIFQTVYQLQRGDYLQCKGSWLADQSYESFFIEKA